jgi:hypothetical protein
MANPSRQYAESASASQNRAHSAAKPDPWSLAPAASLLAADEELTVFRKFDEFNILSLLILQDEIQKLEDELKTLCTANSDEQSTEEAAWYTPMYPLASSNRLAAQTEAEERRRARRQEIWSILRPKLKEYSK